MEYRLVDRGGAEPTKYHGRDPNGCRGARAQAQAISERAKRGWDHLAQDTAPDTVRKPYRRQGSTEAQVIQPPQSASMPAGMDPNMYQYHPSIDLSNPRLRKLAAELGPAYLRVSGTWANSVYFANSENSPDKAPAGFSGVLTRKEWKGVIDFVHAVNGELVTSFATSVGTRNEQGMWTPKEADTWLAYTKSVGGRISAAEFMNEPTYAVMGGAPKGYRAADYDRDVSVFGSWLKQNSPDTVFLGPGSVGEGPFAIAMGGMLHSDDLLRTTGPAFDTFSYHLYAARRNDAQVWATTAKPKRQPRCRRTGFPVPRRLLNTMPVAGELLFLPRFLRIPRPATIL